MIRFSLFIFCFSFSSFSFACKCVPSTLEQKFDKAKAIFLVKVKEIKLTEEANAQNNHISVKYDVLEVFKGKPEENRVVLQELSNCSPGLYPGFHFVLFLSDEGWVSRCTGSFNVPHFPAERGKKELNELRKLSNKLEVL